MKNIFLFLSILFCMTIQTKAQTGATKNVSDAVETLRLAMISSDSVALNSIAHDSLSYGHSGGHIEGKKEFMHKLVSGQSKFLKIDLSDQTISIVGSTAIVRHKLIAETHDAGKDISTVKLSVLLIFQKIKNEWKLLARQAVKA